MKYIRFTITEEEIREVAESGMGMENLSKKQIKLVLSMVECDEILWRKITDSIVGAIRNL